MRHKEYFSNSNRSDDDPRVGSDDDQGLENRSLHIDFGITQRPRPFL